MTLENYSSLNLPGQELWALHFKTFTFLWQMRLCLCCVDEVIFSSIKLRSPKLRVNPTENERTCLVIVLPQEGL